MAFDSEGNLDVANQGMSDIEKFSSTGSDLGVFANPNQGAIGDIVIVPEPSALALLVAVLPPGFLLLRRRSGK